MCEIMPYYNQLYASAAIQFDPLVTHKWSETTGRNSSTQGQSTASANNQHVNSDTPQGLLSIGNIEAELYASSAAIAHDSSTGNSSGTATENVSVTSQGYDADPSELLLKYRETIVNIDQMIVNELQTLFMGVF